MCRTSPVCRNVMTENSAPTPQTALASVNQSARWNSRIIEKGLFSVGGIIINRILYFLQKRYANRDGFWSWIGSVYAFMSCLAYDCPLPVSYTHLRAHETR